jgi:hypothetical protein
MPRAQHSDRIKKGFRGKFGQVAVMSWPVLRSVLQEWRFTFLASHIPLYFGLFELVFAVMHVKPHFQGKKE